MCGGLCDHNLIVWSRAMAPPLCRGLLGAAPLGSRARRAGAGGAGQTDTGAAAPPCSDVYHIKVERAMWGET